MIIIYCRTNKNSPSFPCPEIKILLIIMSQGVTFCHKPEWNLRIGILGIPSLFLLSSLLSLRPSAFSPSLIDRSVKVDRMYR